MDQGTAAVVAASIAAIVAAGTYITAEIIKTLQARGERRAAAFTRVAVALEAVIRAELRPRIARPWNRTDVDVSFAAGNLIAVLSQRELMLWDWIGIKVQGLADASSPEERASRAADISAVLLQWRRARRIARRYVLAELPRLEAATVAD